jgi:hypothetical protein
MSPIPIPDTSLEKENSCPERMNTMMSLLRFILLTALLIVVNAGTRPEDVKWLQAKAAEEGVIATGTGLLYKGELHYELFHSRKESLHLVS